ncbi:MAG: hypothetical protein RLZZ242_1297 [Bacteroidota bacterium]
MRHFFILWCASISMGWAQLQSPAEFLGYELGDAFTRHHEVLSYFEHLQASKPTQVVLQSYGKTNERRPLMVAFIGSEKTIEQLETIKNNHINGLQGATSQSPVSIVWLSYNVHGNESVSTEASMQTAYELLTSRSEWLENTLIILDPCINPDGRERYVNWYNQVKNKNPQPDPNSAEHYEPWHSGRTNHYVFDLNRDWVWTTQTESKARLSLYNQWLPHIHVDFHEQGVDSPYYFAPAAEPIHDQVTQFQRDFQVELGKNHAKYFDSKAWMYFTKERFDLLYPSYGDTYPTFNGAIGMTYEQGGSGRAGLAIRNRDGDLLTLKDRIDHHLTTGLSTVEMAHLNQQRLVEQTKKYFSRTTAAPETYVLSGKSANLRRLTELLDRHHITYHAAKEALVTGYDYRTSTQKRVQIGKQHLLISTDQFKGSLAKVLFDPTATLNDSVTYDITSWSLPFAYDLEALRVSKTLQGTPYAASGPNKAPFNKNTYAYVMNYESFEDQRALSYLLTQGARVRTSYEAFTVNNQTFKAGSSILLVQENPQLEAWMRTCQDVFHSQFSPVSTGFVQQGKDFGSSSVRLTKAPKIALLKGKGVSASNYGEWWYFLEQDLNLPVTTLDHDYFRQVDLHDYDVVIMPDGRYSNWSNSELDRLKDWVKNGGRLIAQSAALQVLSQWDETALKPKSKIQDDLSTSNISYALQERKAISDRITGAIFKTVVDQTHPLAFGYDKNYFSLKLREHYFETLDQGTVFSIASESNPISGFAGANTKNPLRNSLVLGAERVGRGQAVYFVDNPVFRGFWYGAKQAAANAILFDF